jgi:hypothetical protein
MLFKYKCLSKIFFSKIYKRNFCEKINKDFDFESFVKNKKHKQSETNAKSGENKEEPSNKSTNNDTKKEPKKKTSSRSHMYFESKRAQLVNTYKDDFIFFKLSADFDVNELRHKYLEYGK